MTSWTTMNTSESSCSSNRGSSSKSRSKSGQAVTNRSRVERVAELRELVCRYIVKTSSTTNISTHCFALKKNSNENMSYFCRINIIIFSLEQIVVCRRSSSNLWICPESNRLNEVNQYNTRYMEFPAFPWLNRLNTSNKKQSDQIYIKFQLSCVLTSSSVEEPTHKRSNVRYAYPLHDISLY